DTSIEEMLGADFQPEIADLPAEGLLLKAFVDRGLTGYTVVVGSDGGDTLPDGRPAQAIKCVMFTRFPVKAVHNHRIRSARNILEVTLDVDGHPLTVFTNHWKSGASDPATE